MSLKKQTSSAVRAGDLDGLGTIYSQWGGLLTRPGEQVIKTVEDWEMDVRSPWRSILPGMVFFGFSGPVSSRLFVTDDRIVLIREIDIFRELREELTPLGMPKAAEKEADLRRKKAAGARQYCELQTARLHVSRKKRHGRPSRAIDLYLVGDDGREYAISLWKSEGSDSETITLVESRFDR